MAKISTYNLDDRVDSQDRLLGSSYEGVVNGDATYRTKNYLLSDLATFFQSYDPDLDTSISQLNTDVSDLDSRVTTLETAGTDLTSFSVTTNPVGTAAFSYNNTNGVFTYTPPDLSSYLTSVAFADLTSTPTTITGYGITDAFDGSYTSLTNVPTSFPPESHNHDTLYAPLSHNHDDRYYTETEVDTLLSGYLSTSTNLGDLANVSSATPSSGQVLKWTGTEWAPGTDLQASGGTGISLTDLSVSVATAGTANLAYNNTNGTFTYTPPDLTTYVSLTGLSAVNSGTASGSGSLAYNNTSGAFTYTPPDLSSYITLSSLSVNTNPVGTAALSYSSATGIFNYTPPDLSGYLPLTGGTLTGDLILATGADLILQGGDIAVTGNITASSVASPIIVGDVYSAGPSSTIVLENGSGATPNAYFIGDLTTGSGAADLVFDTSTTTFRKNVNIGTTSENLNITLGETSKIYFADGAAAEDPTDPYTFINATSTSNWDAAYGSYVRDLGFYLSDSQNRRFGINITGDSSGTYDRNITDVIAEGSYLSFSADGNGMLTMSVDTNSNPANGDLGVATVSYVNNKFASDATTIGWLIDSTVTTPDSVNIVLKGEDGVYFVYEEDDTNNPNGYDDFRIRYSKGVEGLSINNTTGVLTITRTGVGGATTTVTENLQTYVDSRVSAGAAPSLQQVLDSTGGNSASTNMELVGTNSTNGMLLVRRSDATGDNLVATFDTNGSSGHIRLGSDGSNNDAAITYGYLGMAADGNLFLSNASSTSGGVLIDASDNVGIGAINNTYNFNVNGSARISSTLLVEALTSLQQGVNISGGAFQVANTTGNTTLTGTLDVSGDTSLDITRIDGALTVASASNFESVVTLKANLLPDATANNRQIGTSSAKFNKVYTNNLNDTPTGNLANKTQATTFYDGSAYKNVTAADFILASDINLKENIIPLSDRKIDVDFKEYNFKGSKRTRFGVIAQEIEEKHPEFVHTREGGDKTVSYIDLLVAKVHELENRIKELESASTR